MKKRKKCKRCKGTGRILNPKYKDQIFVVPPPDYEIACPDCKGTGQRKRWE